MFHQTFALTDIFKVFFIGFSELLLAADNAIVIALLVKRLPSSMRKLALLIGISSACVLRLIALFFVHILVRYYWIEIMGALFLFALSFHYFFRERKFPTTERAHHWGTFWLIVALIELTDLAFALDAILATFAFITPFQVPGSINPKLWIVFLGGVIGLIGIRYAAEIFTKLMESFPKIEDSAHLMVTWIGVWLFIDGLAKAFLSNIMELPLTRIIFWIGIAIFFLLGLFTSKRKKRHE